MLEIKNLQVAYGGKPVLKGLDLSLESGKVHGLVGLNGAGKTTFLNTLFGFVKAQSGQMIYNGAPLQREQVGFLETNPAFYRNLTGREFLQLYQNERFKTDAWEDLLQVPLDMLIDHYSTGMQKKLALMALLKQNRPILLLDEPYNGLDLEAAHRLQEILKRLRLQGKTMLFTSHILESLLPVCDYIHHLDNGVIAASYAPEQFDLFSENLRAQLQLGLDEALDSLT
jgi:ABC-2 type transport system ATP-binding protein